MIKQFDWDSLSVDLIPQAVLKYPPAYFEKRLGFTFKDIVDGLGDFRGVLLSLDELTFALKRYRGHKEGTTTLYLSRDFTDVESITQAIGIIVKGLGLNVNDIVWQRKDTPDA
jgi:hypothetical protein